jgi:hypothetical protein
MEAFGHKPVFVPGYSTIIVSFQLIYTPIYNLLCSYEEVVEQETMCLVFVEHQTHLAFSVPLRMLGCNVVGRWLCDSIVHLSSIAHFGLVNTTFRPGLHKVL